MPCKPPGDPRPGTAVGRQSPAGTAPPWKPRPMPQARGTERAEGRGAGAIPAPGAAHIPHAPASSDSHAVAESG